MKIGERGKYGEIRIQRYSNGNFGKAENCFLILDNIPSPFHPFHPNAYFYFLTEASVSGWGGGGGAVGQNIYCYQPKMKRFEIFAEKKHKKDRIS